MYSRETDSSETPNGNIDSEDQQNQPKGSFPLDTLPEPAKTFVKTVAMALPVAPELVAVPVIATASGAIANARAIEIKKGWIEPASVFAAGVGETGTMKSPALRKATAPLRNAQKDDRRTWTTDTTVEALCEKLEDNPRGIAIIRDELSGLIRSFDQYKEGHGADKQFFLSAWDCSPYTVDRKSKPTINLPSPFVTIVGCIPPDLITELHDPQGKEDGFIQRFLFGWAEKPVTVRWSDIEETDEVTGPYASLIERLLELEMVNGKPVVLGLDADALKLFRDWHDEHMAQLENHSLPHLYRGFLAKLKGYCARLALINALMTDPKAADVGAASVQRAIVQTEYFKTQAAKVCRSVGVGKEVKGDPVERCVIEILKKMFLNKNFNRHSLRHNTQFQEDHIFDEAWKVIESGRIDFNNLFLLHSTDKPTPTRKAA